MGVSVSYRSLDSILCVLFVHAAVHRGPSLDTTSNLFICYDSCPFSTVACQGPAI